MAFRRVVNVAVSLFVSGFAVYTATQLASFLSWSSSHTAAIQISRSPLICALWDVGLALQFCFQHSVLCWPRVCSAVDHICGALSRSVYLLTSCLSLKVTMSMVVLHKRPYNSSVSAPDPAVVAPGQSHFVVHQRGFSSLVDTCCHPWCLLGCHLHRLHHH
uniref:Nuclear envelope membrane protein n=1 Tax=Rhipicephalus zambeziensis TaxID=60191 RepID=A0A224YIX8_9ACAR